MSDWNDARYEFYDNCIARGMTPKEAEEALNREICRQLGLKYEEGDERESTNNKTSAE